jgi:hypothetical protein
VINPKAAPCDEGVGDSPDALLGHVISYARAGQPYEFSERFMKMSFFSYGPARIMPNM